MGAAGREGGRGGLWFSFSVQEPPTRPKPSPHSPVLTKREGGTMRCCCWAAVRNGCTRKVVTWTSTVRAEKKNLHIYVMSYRRSRENCSHQLVSLSHSSPWVGVPRVTPQLLFTQRRGEARRGEPQKEACVSVCACVRVCAHVHVHASVCLCVHACACLCMDVRAHACTCACLCARMCMRMCIRMCMCVCMLVCACACV